MRRDSSRCVERTQVHDGRTAATVMRAGLAEGKHLRQSREQSMNAALELAHALAMNHAHLKKAACATLGQISRHQFADVLRAEGVQVERAVDGKHRRQILGIRFMLIHTRTLQWSADRRLVQPKSSLASAILF